MNRPSPSRLAKMKVHFERAKPFSGRPLCSHHIWAKLTKRWKNVTCEVCKSKRKVKR